MPFLISKSSIFWINYTLNAMLSLIIASCLLVDFTLTVSIYIFFFLIVRQFCPDPHFNIKLKLITVSACDMYTIVCYIKKQHIKLHIIIKLCRVFHLSQRCIFCFAYFVWHVYFMSLLDIGPKSVEI